MRNGKLAAGTNTRLTREVIAASGAARRAAWLDSIRFSHDFGARNP